MDGEQLIPVGVALVLLGIVVVMAGVLAGNADVEAEGGAVIFVGPVPIVLGSDAKNAAFVSLLALGLIFAYVFLLRG